MIAIIILEFENSELALGGALSVILTTSVTGEFSDSSIVWYVVATGSEYDYLECDWRCECGALCLQVEHGSIKHQEG
jgi:hypothetical protein